MALRSARCQRPPTEKFMSRVDRTCIGLQRTSHVEERFQPLSSELVSGLPVNSDRCESAASLEIF